MTIEQRDPPDELDSIAEEAGQRSLIELDVDPDAEREADPHPEGAEMPSRLDVPFESPVADQLDQQIEAELDDERGGD